MSELGVITTVVIDVLGTLVDEPGGLTTAIAEAAGDKQDVAELLAVWQGHIEQQQQRILRGLRAYANSDQLDAEAAGLVMDRADITDPARRAHLAAATRRLRPWADAPAGVDRLAQHVTVFALSNSSVATLEELGDNAELRWHRALSAEEVRTYKPSPEVYRLAIETAGTPPNHMLMVAAHAWDLRAAQAAGMRAAYVHRPVGDAPSHTDRFDGYFDGLDELATALRG